MSRGLALNLGMKTETHLKLSWRLSLIKYSQAISRVSRFKITDVSGTISVPIISAVM
jgi:hypothetical protein